MIDLSKDPLFDVAVPVFKRLGVRLYQNYYTRETYINYNYWRDLPDIGKEALIMVYKSFEKENNNDAKHD